MVLFASLPIAERVILFLGTGFGASLLAQALSEAVRRLRFLSFPEKWLGGGFAGTLIGLAGVLLLGPLDSTGRYFLLAGLTLASIWIAGESARIFAVKDDPRIVIDEIAGIFWTFAGISWGALGPTERIVFFAAGFILFRIFDVLKLPLRRLENLQGGIGIVADDVAAAILANLCLRLWIGFLH